MIRLDHCLVALLIATVLSLVTAPAQERMSRSPRITMLIQNLGSEIESVREAAREELLKLDLTALEALEAARDGDDAETSTEAVALIERIRAHTHVIVDALGVAIADAEIRLLEGPDSVRSNRLGHIDLPTVDGGHRDAVVSHPEYGGPRVATPAGDLFEGLVYGRELDEREREAVQRYLAGKYGLAP